MGASQQNSPGAVHVPPEVRYGIQDLMVLLPTASYLGAPGQLGVHVVGT